MLHDVACLWGSSERACRARVVRLFCCTCAVVEVNVINYDAGLEFGKLQDQIFPVPSLPLRITKVNNQQFNIDLLPVGKVFQLVKIFRIRIPGKLHLSAMQRKLLFCCVAVLFLQGVLQDCIKSTILFVLTVSFVCFYLSNCFIVSCNVVILGVRFCLR